MSHPSIFCYPPLFLQALGISPLPMGVLMHFAYGIGWAIVLLAVVSEATDIRRGLAIALIVQ